METTDSNPKLAQPGRPSAGRPQGPVRRVQLRTPIQVRHVLERLTYDMLQSGLIDWPMTVGKLKAMAYSTQALAKVWEGEEMVRKYEMLREEIRGIRIAPATPLQRAAQQQQPHGTVQ